LDHTVVNNILNELRDVAMKKNANAAADLDRWSQK